MTALIRKISATLENKAKFGAKYVKKTRDISHTQNR